MFPQAIYGQIALGNGYQFDVRESYHVVTEADYGATALVDVYYAAGVNNSIEKINKGIVSYNKNLLVYVAAEFDTEKITNEQITTIAASIQIT